MLIRDATPAEHGAIQALTLRAYSEYAHVMSADAWPHLRSAIISGLALEEAQHIVAEHASRIVGSVLLYPSGANAYDLEGTGASAWPEIRLLAVPPESRGLGVASALVEECIRRARELGALYLGLHTSRSMGAAIRLYAKMGFERAPDSDFDVHGAELIEGYRLRITSDPVAPDRP